MVISEMTRCKECGVDFEEIKKQLVELISEVNSIRRSTSAQSKTASAQSRRQSSAQ